jgi:hypothetical protein
LRESDAFRSWVNSVLAAAPYSAFRWETPPIHRSLADRPFEFALLDSPGLARSPSFDAFAEKFSAGRREMVLAFPNLGGDGTMIVPSPLGPSSAYGHMAAFVREAPAEQQDALWRLVGEETEKQVSDAPRWLSTAGAGVPWLHVRIDSTPKYYGHRPYTQLSNPAKS